MPLHQSEYGVSMGGYRQVEPVPSQLDISKGGLDLSKTPNKLDEGSTPAATNVKFDRGGVSADNLIVTFSTAAGGVANKNVMHLAPHVLAAGTKFLMRLRPTKWDRWNGSNWLELSGTLTGLDSDYLYSLSYGDIFVAANGTDKLKKWDGVDGNAVADLSATAPIASYIVKVGTRILAARIKSGGNLFPYDVAWCADGDITDWTTAANGAGAATLGPEGAAHSSGHIRGLSTLQGSGVIYRDQSIIMAMQTGIGAAPFRFVPVDFNHGTESPYSIASGGMRTGDYFLGEDYMVYFFDGSAKPEPIGDPIASALRTSIFNANVVLGAVDARSQEYVLAYATDSSLLLKRAYAFSIREWVNTGRLVWRQKNLSGYKTIGAGNIPTGSDPFINDVPDIIDTVNRRIDDFANTSADKRLVIGDTVGQVYYVDITQFVTDGTWTSKVVGDSHREVSIGRLRLLGTATSMSTVEVAISSDRGTTWQGNIVYTIDVSTNSSFEVGDYFGVDATIYQFRLRILSGDPVISEISYDLHPHGRAA